MRDFLPEDVRRRDHVVGVVRRVYERYGFEPLETPAVENIDTLLGKYGEEGNKLIFKILKRGEHEATGEADLALRYDLTVPLARVVAEHQAKLPKFFKRYQIQPVWRADRPARGRFREFYQCDIDTIGSTSPIVEAEQITAVGDVLAGLGFSGFKILLNHRSVLTGLLDVAGVPREQHESALVALDKFDKIGQKGVEEEFLSRGIDSFAAAGVINMLRDIQTKQLDPGVSTGRLVNNERLHSLGGFLEQSESRAAVENLREIVRLVSSDPVADHVLVSPQLARGLSYYTGAIMEIAVDGIGSLGGGGRYDHLIGMFLGREIPACGFSLGLERILVVMGERGMFPDSIAGTGAEVMVTLWNADTRGDALALAGLLRAGGLRVETYPDADKIGKQFKYASSRRIPFVAVVGDDERARGEVAVKDMRSGEQVVVKREEVAGYLGTQVVRAKADTPTD
jgi:histidyl-tRNA synthetase